MAENEFINEGDLPFSLEAEQAVLGSILLDPSCLVPVSLIIKTEHFYLPQHREIFKSMLTLDQMNGSSVDPLLILNALNLVGTSTDALALHTKLVDAIEKGDEDDAQDQILKHLALSMRNFEYSLQVGARKKKA